MNNPDILLYACNDMMPGNLDAVIDEVKLSGITHLVLALCHIGPDGSVLWFNESPFIASSAVIPFFEGWQAQLQQILDAGIVKRISASFGGGGGGPAVTDFARLEAIYKGNNNSFAGTLLEYNFKLMKKAFPAITCIDMDNEELNDKTSFIAFCKMVHDIGFDLSFCPFAENNSNAFRFWLDCLQEIEETWGKGSVKRLNIQTYEFMTASPKNWGDAIKERLPNFDTSNFINFGYKASWHASGETWYGMTPRIVTDSYAYYSKFPEVGGAFFWNYDLIRITTLVPRPKEKDPKIQHGYFVLKDYVMAIWNGMASEPTAIAQANDSEV
jgi:hypothetical protein